ncbi:hypothetical protein [Papillibacter cinnamivorans]|uniref:hypothetical protein n=1 Tax=Papillibacter cinnamivorans TaxID=100176 RepID=UPI000A069B11|nr:hypothetical protein [Papillibacter cinnamivorans]
MIYYPEAKVNLGDDFEAEAWAAVLRQASDADILRALAAHVRSGNKFAPNAGEIAALCGLEAAALPKAPSSGRERMMAVYAGIVAYYRELGVPTAVEAKRDGISYRDWCVMVDEAEEKLRLEGKDER